MEQALKQLKRSRRERVFGGICGGLADYLGWDTVLVRVAWVALTVLTSGSGILLYLLAWVIIPLEKTGDYTYKQPRKSERSDTRIVIGILIVVAGILALCSSLLPWYWNISWFRIIGPVVLIVLGVILLVRFASREGANSQNSPGQKAVPVPEYSLPRRFVRIHEGRKIAGVCTGLGYYFNVDPTLIRILWMILILTYGIGILVYVLFWIAMPLVDRRPENRSQQV